MCQCAAETTGNKPETIGNRSASASQIPPLVCRPAVLSSLCDRSACGVSKPDRPEQFIQRQAFAVVLEMPRSSVRVWARSRSSLAPCENLVPKLVPDSSELSRTPWTQSALLGQIRFLRHLPAELLIRRSLVRTQPGALAASWELVSTSRADLCNPFGPWLPTRSEST